MGHTRAPEPKRGSHGESEHGPANWLLKGLTVATIFVNLAVLRALDGLGLVLRAWAALLHPLRARPPVVPAKARILARWAPTCRCCHGRTWPHAKRRPRRHPYKRGRAIAARVAQLASSYRTHGTASDGLSGPQKCMRICLMSIFCLSLMHARAIDRYWHIYI